MDGVTWEEGKRKSACNRRATPSDNQIQSAIHSSENTDLIVGLARDCLPCGSLLRDLQAICPKNQCLFSGKDKSNKAANDMEAAELLIELKYSSSSKSCVEHNDSNASAVLCYEKESRACKNPKRRRMGFRTKICRKRKRSALQEDVDVQAQSRFRSMSDILSSSQY